MIMFVFVKGIDRYRNPQYQRFMKILDEARRDPEFKVYRFQIHLYILHGHNIYNNYYFLCKDITECFEFQNI